MSRRTSSHALAASALHYSSDLISSVLALLDLGATRAGYPTLPHSQPSTSPDLSPSRAIARPGRRSTPLWTEPPTDRPARCALVTQTPGVAGTEAIRRTNGARIVGDLIVSVPRTLPLERVAADQGGACDAERRAIAAGKSDHHRQSYRARRRDDPRTRAADRDAPASAGASCRHPGRGRPQERGARSRSRQR